MFEKISTAAVDGFLRVDGRRIINGKGEEFLPLGVAFGNWLLCEGNMWAFGEGNYYDRPRRFEALVRELCGSRYASTFWERFHNNFINESDIEAIAAYGFNSVRIPINWRILLEDEPELCFIEEGFELLLDVIRANQAIKDVQFNLNLIGVTIDIVEIGVIMVISDGLTESSEPSVKISHC